MSKLIAPPIPCTVEHITGIKPGQFGDYQSILFKSADGSKIWKSFVPGSPELAELPVGRRVYLVEAGVSKSGKMSHNVILMDEPTAPGPIAPTPSPAPAPTAGTIPDDVKRAIAAYVSDGAKLYAFCHSEATRALASQTTDPETIRCAASSLFISASRKFGL